MKNILVSLSLLLLFSPAVCLAENPSSAYFKGIEVSTGFGMNKLEEKGTYLIHPLLVDFNFDLKPALKNIMICPPGFFLFQYEPFISLGTHPNMNIEIGNAFMFKVGLSPERCQLQPYVKAGVGILYMSQVTYEQSTQFNFLEQVGMGIHYFITKNTAVTGEGLYRHISNGGIKQPNGGLNTFFITLGIAYNF